MKKLIALILTLSMALVVTGCNNNSKNSENASGANQFTLKLATASSDDCALVNAVKVFIENVENRTEGNVKIQLYTNSKLGSVSETTQQVQEGNIEMALISTDILASFWPEFNIFNAPYAFKEKSECDDIWRGEIGQQLFSIMEADNIHVLNQNECTYNGTGFRMTTSNKAINSLSDMKNLKFRVMENPILLEAWKNLGCNPTPVAYTELFTALQQGTVEAQENPLDIIYTQKFYEVQDYIILTNHLLCPDPLCINAELFNSMPEEYQTILEEEADNAGIKQREISAELESTYKEEIESTGVTFIELPDNVLDDFKGAVGPAYDMVIDSAGSIAEDFFTKLDIKW